MADLKPEFAARMDAAVGAIGKAIEIDQSAAELKTKLLRTADKYQLTDNGLDHATQDAYDGSTTKVIEPDIVAAALDGACKRLKELATYKPFQYFRDATTKETMDYE